MAHLSLKGKTVAVTGASGAMGRALIQVLASEGANLIALTTAKEPEFDTAVEILPWQAGAERSLEKRFQTVDILIINHGINVYGDRGPAAIKKSLEVNAFSALALMDVFLDSLSSSPAPEAKEIWINTSEAEVSPALSPLYEVSKRLLGDLVTLKRLDAPCLLRKIVLGPFKSNLNPFGVMSTPWVARAVVTLAKRGYRNIIVTINPITYLTFPLKEMFQSLYFQIFSQADPTAQSNSKN